MAQDPVAPVTEAPPTPAPTPPAPAAKPSDLATPDPQRRARAPSSCPPSPRPVRAAPGARKTLHGTKGPLPWCPGSDARNSGSARHSTTSGPGSGHEVPGRHPEPGQQRAGASGSSDNQRQQAQMNFKSQATLPPNGQQRKTTHFPPGEPESRSGHYFQGTGRETPSSSTLKDSRKIVPQKGNENSPETKATEYRDLTENSR